MSDWVIWLLGAMNAFQLVFWSYQLHRLVDKVMSGNYYNYQQAKGLHEEKPKTDSHVDPETLEDLRGVKAIHPFM